jgi:DNA-binding LacI/PurR family transcriptional regulator
MVYLLSSGRLSKINNTKPRLAGFVDIELIDLKDVVAYVEQPVRDLGRYAGRVVKQILKEKTIAYYHVLVPCELRFL